MEAKKRKAKLEALYNSESFNNKILILGCGAIGTVLLPILLKIINVDPKNIIIIDKNLLRKNKINKYIELGVTFINTKITRNNLKQLIIEDVGLTNNDIIIDASYGINTNDMFDICNMCGISYINSAIELWDDDDNLDALEYTFGNRIKSLEKQHHLNNGIYNNNFIVSMGCNPGNVNIWVLYALKKINRQTNNYDFTDYSELANKMGLNVIHISEKDTQQSNIPKKKNEYANTWASDAVSYYDESTAFLEISWGAHEKSIPTNIDITLSNEYQKIIEDKPYVRLAKSYTPLSNEIVGMLTRHEECYTISMKLTHHDQYNNIIYRPSCYFVYKPCNLAIKSLAEMVENNEQYQSNFRLMTNDIIKGRDELGCTLFFSNGDIYWVGSLLDINETRELFNNELNDIINSTILQVVAGYMGGLLYLIKSIKDNNFKGLLKPEDMNIKQFLKWTKPFLGIFGVKKVTDWTAQSTLFNEQSKLKTHIWQFNDFLVK